MDRNTKIIITLPTSPYRILGVPFDAETKAINRAMRALMAKNPREGAQLGNRAQKKLTDPKERMKEDALCLEVDLPEMDFASLTARLAGEGAEAAIPALKDPSRFSDLAFPELLDSPLTFPEPLGPIPYRRNHDTRK